MSGEGLRVELTLQDEQIAYKVYGEGTNSEIRQAILDFVRRRNKNENTNNQKR